MKIKDEALGLKEKIKEKTRRPSKPLRFKLTRSFIIYTAFLIGLLWLLQALLLDQYYEYSMMRKSSAAISAVSTAYSSGESLDVEAFCDRISQVSRENDIYFYVEAEDGSFYIASTDTRVQGRISQNYGSLISDARKSLMNGGDSLSFSVTAENGAKILVHARRVESSFRDPVYLYAITPLSPLGPAVSILRSQLFLVSAVAIALGIIIARWTSKRLATPVINMEKKAGELVKGNYDVVFEGGDYQEIDDLAATLTHTAENLARTDELQKDLLANISHDLRTPLTMIKSYSEMIRDISGDNKEKRDEHLGVIIDETDRLADLVNDILSISKLQSGAMEFEMAPFDIQKAAESVLATYRVLEQEGFEFSFRPVPGTVTVTGDERKIQQVIGNLISNAVRYSGDEKKVAVVFSLEDNAVRCSIADKGIGIAEEDLDSIWNRYQKASRQGYRSKQGTGLGLSIVKEILERHGARYGVESSPGEGSIFWFSMDMS